MKLRISEGSESKLREGDLELYSEPEYIGPYGVDGWETDDDDYYNFKQLGLKTVRDVVDFYKDLSKIQIVARNGAYGVLGDIDWNVRHRYWDDKNTQAVIDALDSDPAFKFYGESLKRNKSKRLREQNVEIEVKHEGILEVPEGKNVDDLPLSHFEKLAKKKGLGKITKALNNLQVWNKNDDPKLSKWAGDMIDKLTKKFGKNESISGNRFNEGWHSGDASISFTHNDDLEADLEEFLFDLFSDNPDVFEFDWSGRNTILYLACSEDDYKYIKWFIEDWKYKHRDEYDEYDESLKEDYIDGEDESLKEDYINIDGFSYDETAIWQMYRRIELCELQYELGKSAYRATYHSGEEEYKEFKKLCKLYNDVGGNEDEFIIDAVNSGFSKLGITVFLMCGAADNFSLREIKGLFKSLNISLKESSMYDYYDVPDGAFDMHNDMPTEEDEMWSELSTKQREIINALEELGYSGSLTRFFSKIIGSWTKVYDTDKSTSSGVEITVDLDGKVTVQEFVYSADEEDLTDLSPVKVVKSAADVKKLDSWAKRIKKHDISL